MLKNENDIMPNVQKFGIAIADSSVIDSLGGFSLIYSVRFNSDNIGAFREHINNNYIALKWLSSTDNTRISGVDGDVGGFFQLGRIMPIVILIITSLLIAVVMWRQLKSEFSQMGTLYAIGYSKLKLLVHYSTYPLSITLAGALLGQILGIYLKESLLATQAIQYNLPVITFRVEPQIILVSVLLPLVLIVPACIYVIMKALKLSPVELIKGVFGENGPSFLERKINLKKLSFDNRFKIRELIRNIPRTLLTLLSVMFASSMLLLGFVMNDSINWVFNKGYDENYKYNYFYTFNTLQSIEEVEGEKVWMLPFQGESPAGKMVSFKLQGMERDAKLIEVKNKGGEKISYSKNIITGGLSKKLGVKSGETIKIISQIDEKIIKIKVDEIADTYIGDYIYVPIEFFYNELNVPRNSYIGVLSEKNLNYDKAILMTEIKKSDITESFKTMTKPLKALLFFIAAAAAAIGLILIYIITSLIIEENRSNISLLKIMGYQKGKIYSLILNTNTLVVVIAYLISIPLVLLGVDKLFAVITQEMDFSIPGKINNINIFIGFIIVFITYQSAKLLTRRKVIAIPMSEALKAARE
jgi:putative ABC transport system permease protein